MLDEKRQAAKAKRRKLAAEIGMHQTIRLLEQEGLLFHDDTEGEINLDLIEAQLSELIKRALVQRREWQRGVAKTLVSDATVEEHCSN